MQKQIYLVSENAKTDYFEKTTTKNTNYSKRLWQKSTNRYNLNIQQNNDPTSFSEQWRNTSGAIRYCQWLKLLI